MEEPKNLTKRNKKNISINLASGGGLGVGIVFIGGALATAAALVSVLTVGMKLLKSSKNRKTGSNETLEKFTAGNIISTNKDESKGLHQSLSNGAAKTVIMTESDVGRISSKTFFQEEEQNLEPYSGKGDPAYDDKEILLSKTEEFSFIVIKDQMLFQNENMKEAAKTGETDPNDALLMQSNEEQRSPSIDPDENSNSTGCFSSKSSISVDQDLLVPLLQDEKLKSDSEEGSQAFEALLIVQIAEVIQRDDELDAADQEEKLDKHDGLLTVEDAQGLELEEEKALEPAEGKDETEILMLNKEISAPRDDEFDEAKLVDVTAPVSSNDLLKQPTKEQGLPIDDMQEDQYVSDIIPSEEVAGGSDCNFELLSEASEIREENDSSEPASEESEDGVIESDVHQVKQSVSNNSLEKIEEKPATTEPDTLGVTGEMEMSEEDSINNDTDEANIMDKVEENSEGAGDSSAEYNTEPIWPAESLKELSKDLAKLKFEDQKENKTLQTMEKMYLDKVEDCSVSNESLQNINKDRGNSKMAFLEKYMLELVEQNVQQTNSPKPRIFGWTWLFMVLSWALSFWCFGLPFLKISLIVILVILLSKIQGI